MHRDHQHASGFTKAHERKEWGRSSDQEHQMEAREHARQPGKLHKAEGIRRVEAQRQILELRARY